MFLETTLFTCKINVPFEQCSAVYDSEENLEMKRQLGITCLFKGVNKDDPNSLILIEQGELGKSIALFEDLTVNTLIQAAGHIYDSIVISSSF